MIFTVRVDRSYTEQRIEVVEEHAVLEVSAETEQEALYLVGKIAPDEEGYLDWVEDSSETRDVLSRTESELGATSIAAKTPAEVVIDILEEKANDAPLLAKCRVCGVITLHTDGEGQCPGCITDRRSR